MLRRPDLLGGLPLHRLLTETDHPFGDRLGGRGRRPGHVDDVERALAQLHGMDQDEVRRELWRNLKELVRSTKCGILLPRPVRLTLAAEAS
jgi:TatD DNase family protein